jgi:hypothetical protein
MTEAGVTGSRGWFKSSFSKDANSCVEVRFTDGMVFVRDSKYLRDPSNDPALQPTIALSAESWTAFLSLTTVDTAVLVPGLRSVEHHDSGGLTITATDGTALTYTQSEWTAFAAGIRAGEFAAA